jgi:hypothetical protein
VPTLVSAIIIFHSLGTAQTSPHLFCGAILLTLALFNVDFGLPITGMSLFVCLLLVTKSTKVLRYLGLRSKHRVLPSSIYKGLMVNLSKYFTKLILCYFVCMIPQFHGIHLDGFDWRPNTDFLWV